MTSAKKRRVQIRRTEAGANDPIQQARQTGIREGRAEAQADYLRAEKALIARVKADERAVRDRVVARMEKEIEDLQERCRVLERQASKVRPEPEAWTKPESKEWIAQFDEEDTQIEVVRRGGPMDR